MAAAQERMTIVNSHGEKLAGILHETGRQELVILCHGLNSSKDCELHANITSMLVEAGLTVFRFDFSGNGESEGEFQFGNYSKEVEDLRSVVAHWMQRGRIVKAIIGHSKGGSTVLLYASKYHDVHKIVNASGRLNTKEGLQQFLGDNFMHEIDKAGFLDFKDKTGKVIFRITRDSLMERLNTDIKQAVLQISKDCRILTVHGSEDEMVPVKEAFECDKVIANHTLRVIDGADHMYSHHRKDLVDELITFIYPDLGCCLQSTNISGA